VLDQLAQQPVHQRDVRAAARRGLYQSNQATAAACAVNDVHLLRGMLGRPGAGVLQMNGQPTAQNTRETGADGDLTGMRNWDNPRHVEELAELWNVEPATIPHWAPPTHAMQIWRYAEQGSIQLLWFSATSANACASRNGFRFVVIDCERPVQRLLRLTRLEGQFEHAEE
jgi:anaerobic selenocysteine-containing dehydrogenase